jgi:hypothetical protein
VTTIAATTSVDLAKILLFSAMMLYARTLRAVTMMNYFWRSQTSYRSQTTYVKELSLPMSSVQYHTYAMASITNRTYLNYAEVLDASHKSPSNEDFPLEEIST